VSKRNDSGQSENKVKDKANKPAMSASLMIAARDGKAKITASTPSQKISSGHRQRARLCKCAARRSIVAVAAGTLIARRRAQTVLADAR
jgi:hypothetical protein